MPKRVFRTLKDILALFNDLGVVYRVRTKVDWEPLLKKKLDNSPYYRENKEEFESLVRQYGPKIDRGAMAPVYIRKIDDIIGYGVFASRDISRGDFIGEYAGVVQISGKHTNSFNEDNGYESDYSWYYLDEVDKAPSLEINGRLEGNEMRFVNHGKKPNLCVEHMLYQGQWVLFFTAAKKIKKDEQLLISYGESYWEEEYRKKQTI